MTPYPYRGPIYQTQLLSIPDIEGERPLTIYLPPGYESTADFYPVAYLFDGQNLFEDMGTPAGGWHLHSVLDERANAGLVVPIVIGIHHGPLRDEELCPWPAELDWDAKGDIFLDWLVEWLYPCVNKQFRVLEGSEHTMVGGSSLGGLLALYAFFRHSLIFGRAMAMSPSLWVGEGSIYDYVAEASIISSGARLYIDAGALEEDEEAWDESEEEIDESTPLEDSHAMATLLESKGFVEGYHFLWNPDPLGEHNEQSWYQRLPEAFSFLYDS